MTSGGGTKYVNILVEFFIKWICDNGESRSVIVLTIARRRDNQAGPTFMRSGIALHNFTFDKTTSDKFKATSMENYGAWSIDKLKGELHKQKCQSIGPKKNFSKVFYSRTYTMLYMYDACIKHDILDYRNDFVERKLSTMFLYARL